MKQEYIYIIHIVIYLKTKIKGRLKSVKLRSGSEFYWLPTHTTIFDKYSKIKEY